MKTCTKCKKKKNISEFHKNKLHKDGRHNHCKDCVKLYYQKNADTFRSSAKKYRKNNKEKVKQYAESYRMTHIDTFIKYKLLNSALKRAETKNLEYNIDKEWLCKQLESGKCCKTDIEFVYEYNSPYAPSIDRIDSSKGYTKNNCQIVCKIYNFAKNVWTDKDVEIMAIKISEKLQH
ncbi:MAG: hypothetical protein GY861_29285 [bacterium]|nr:hypothetical protein [bacterium]